MEQEQTTTTVRHGFCQWRNPDTDLVLSCELREERGEDVGAEPFYVVNYIGDTEFNRTTYPRLGMAYQGFAEMVREYWKEQDERDSRG